MCGDFEQGAARPCNGASQHFYEHPWCSQSHASPVLFLPRLVGKFLDDDGVAYRHNLMHQAAMQALAMSRQLALFLGLPASRFLVASARFPGQLPLAARCSDAPFLVMNPMPEGRGLELYSISTRNPVRQEPLQLHCTLHQGCMTISLSLPTVAEPFASRERYYRPRTFYLSMAFLLRTRPFSWKRTMRRTVSLCRSRVPKPQEEYSTLQVGCQHDILFP